MKSSFSRSIILLTLFFSSLLNQTSIIVVSAKTNPINDDTDQNSDDNSEEIDWKPRRPRPAPGVKRSSSEFEKKRNKWREAFPDFPPAPTAEATQDDAMNDGSDIDDTPPPPKRTNSRVQDFMDRGLFKKRRREPIDFDIFNTPHSPQFRDEDERREAEHQIEELSRKIHDSRDDHSLHPAFNHNKDTSTFSKRTSLDRHRERHHRPHHSPSTYGIDSKDGMTGKHDEEDTEEKREQHKKPYKRPRSNPIQNFDALRVGVTKKNELCDLKTKRGDILYIHYNATIFNPPVDIARENNLYNKYIDENKDKKTRERNKKHKIPKDSEDKDNEAERTFDSSYDRQTPMRILLGITPIIPGLEKGLFGMCVDEVRKIWIPPSLAYGEVGIFPHTSKNAVPPNSILVFHVQLVKLIVSEEEEDYQHVISHMWDVV